MAKKLTRSEEEDYRLPFFIISSLIMGSMIWLVYQETFTRRPWKNIQLGFFRVEKARAEKNLESEQSWLKNGVVTRKNEAGEPKELQVAARIAELEKSIEEIEGKIINSPKRVEFESLKAELETANVDVKDHEVRLAFGKADEDAAYYKYRHAKHEAHEHDEAEFQKTVDELHNTVLERSTEYDKSVAARDAVTDKLDVIQKQIKESKKELDELKSGTVVAARALDLTKERTTGIEQYWNQSLQLVDRCHTCHMAAEKCGYSDPKEILADAVEHKTSADQLRTKYCLTREEVAGYATAADKVRDSFGDQKELGFADVKDQLHLESEPVLVSATKLDLKPEEADEIYRSHPDRTELLRIHPGNVFGCTTCHYGQGRQTKAVGLNYLTGNTAPKFDHAHHDHYWQSQMLDSKRHHTEASCFNCHKNDYEIAYAPNFSEARKLVQNLGCTGCHPLGPIDPVRKHGPSLSKVASKVDPGYLAEWIKYPRSLRPRTRMPNFWPEVTKKLAPGEKAPLCTAFDYDKGAPPTPAVWTDCAEKREHEVAYITAYLSRESEKPAYPSLPASANAKHGQEVFESYGCMGCHNMGAWSGASHLPGSEDRDLAPNLTAIGNKITNPGWFFAWVKNPKSYWHETRMPMLRLSDEDAWDVAAYLSSQKTSDGPKLNAQLTAAMGEEGAADKGKKLINWYGCFGCHEIKGFEANGRIGADLTEYGSKLPNKLDFGDVPEFQDEHAQTWEAWTRRKVQEPRVYRYERVETRMPQFDATPEELEKATLFLKSQNNEASNYPKNIMYEPTKEKAAIQRGQFLVDSYNCGGCHRIDDRGVDTNGDHVPDGGSIVRWFAEHPDEAHRAPPKLINEGRKVYPDWLFAFLKAPSKLRENYRVRMPTFQFSDEEAGDLVAYFAAKAGSVYPFVQKKHEQLSAQDSEASGKLFAAAQCLSCHNLDGVSKDPRNVAPNLRLAAERLQPEWLFDWLKDPQAQAPGVGMPGFFTPVDDKPGEYTTPLPEFAGGDWHRQIELLRAYVIRLGEKPQMALMTPEGSLPADHPGKKRKH